MAHVLAMMAGVNARCAGKSVGGDGATWSAVSPHLPTPSSHPVCSCVALQQAVSYASIYKAKGRHQLIQRRACSRWDQVSPLGQPGRACSRVVATVMPCTRALCVRAGPVGAVCRGRCWRVCGQARGRPLGLRCAVCSEFMLHAPAPSVAGHAKALRSVRRAGKR